MKKAKIAIVVLILGVVTAFIGCAMQEKIVVPITKPAEVNLKGIDQIAVGDITGFKGDDISDKITTALFNSGRYEVLDRDNLNNILREQSLSMVGITDPEASAKLGKVLGATAIVTGRIGGHDYNNSGVTETNNWRAKDGTLHRSYQRTETAYLDVNLRVIDVQTGKIIAIKQIKPEYEKKHTATDKDPAYYGSDQIYDLLVEEIVTRFVKSIAPYTIHVEMAFQRDNEIPTMEQGINMAKIGNWDNALVSFAKAVEERPDSWKTHYNLALANECCEEYDKAIEGFTTAYAMNPTTKIEGKISACRQHKADKEKLQKQLEDAN